MQLSFEEVIRHELQRLYSVETQLADGLKMLAKSAQASDLKAALEAHRVETVTHIARVEQVCSGLGFSPVGTPSLVVKAMQMEALLSLNGTEPSPVGDAVIVKAAQSSEHLEIAAYGSVIAILQRLGHADAADLLQQTVKEEEAASEMLTQFALSGPVQNAVVTLR